MIQFSEEYQNLEAVKKYNSLIDNIKNLPEEARNRVRELYPLTQDINDSKKISELEKGTNEIIEKYLPKKV